MLGDSPTATRKVTVIVPVYNDRDAILNGYRDICEGLRDAPFSWGVLYVNDGSRDNPEDIFDAHDIPYVSHEQNRGYGAALKTGVEKSDSEFVCFIDCDGTYPAHQIPDLMLHAEEADMVVGARDVRKNPPLHVVAKSTICWLLSSLFGQDVQDINSGLRVIRRDVFEYFRPALRDRFSLTSSITYGFLLLGRPIIYTPIEYYKRVGDTHVRRVSFTKEWIRCMCGMRRFCIEKRGDPSAPWADETVPDVEDEPSNERKKSRVLATEIAIHALLVAFAIVGAFLTRGDQLFDSLAANDDVAQHGWWLASLHQPELYQQDIYWQYAHGMATPGVTALYWVGTLAVDPVVFGKMLHVALWALMGLICYWIGKALGGRWLGVLVALLFIGHPEFQDRFEGGLQRAFMFPLLGGFMAALYARKFIAIPFILAAGMLTYMLAPLLSLAALVVFLLFEPRSLMRLVKPWPIWIGWATLLASLLFLNTYRDANKPDFLGEMMTGAEMLEDPAYYDGGRHESYFPFDSLDLIVDRHWDHGSDPVKYLSLAALLLIAIRLVQGRDWRKELAPSLALLIASVALWKTAQLVLFRLYIPERYVTFSFSILGCVLAALGFVAIGSLIKWKRLRWGVWALLVVALFWEGMEGTREYSAETPWSARDEKILIEALRKETAPGSLIMAGPYLSDEIAVFAQRSGYIRRELYHAWYRGYRQMVEDRVRQFYDVYFSDSPEEILRFVEENDIDLIVVDAKWFSVNRRKKMKFFDDPLGSAVDAELQLDQRSRSDFALPKLAAEGGQRLDDRFTLLPAGAIRRIVDNGG